MKIVSDKYKENIKKFGRELDNKITYELNNEIIVLNTENIRSATPMFKSNVLKSAMKQLEIDCKVDIPLNTVLNYQFGVKINNEYEYINYGNYVVYSSEKQEDTNSYRIVCYDKMLYSMKDYESLGVTYPITIRNYLIALCNKLGLTFANANQTFVNYDKEIPSELYLDNQGNSLGYTFRDVLDELAEVTASTICINNNDELEIRYITGSIKTIEGKQFSINSEREDYLKLEIQGDTYQETTEGKNLLNYNNTSFTAEESGWHFLDGVKVSESGGISLPDYSNLEYKSDYCFIYHYTSEPYSSYTGEDNVYLLFFNESYAISWGYYSPTYFTDSLDARGYQGRPNNWVKSVYVLNGNQWDLVTNSGGYGFNAPGGGYNSVVTGYKSTIDVYTFSVYDYSTRYDDLTYPAGYDITSGGSSTTDKQVAVEQNKPYTFSYNITTAPSQIQLEYDDESIIATITPTTGYNSYTFTSSKNGYLIPKLNVNENSSCVITNMMVEQNNEATSYEPYSTPSPSPSHEQEINSTTGLQNIEVVSGENNNEYQIDLGSEKLTNTVNRNKIYNVGEDWYYEKQNNEIVLDGTETGWAYNSSEKYFYNSSYNFGSNIPLEINDTNKNIYKQYSNYFKMNKDNFVEGDDITVPTRSNTPTNNNNLIATSLTISNQGTTVLSKYQNNGYGSYWTEFNLNEKADKISASFNFSSSELYNTKNNITFTIIFNKNIFDKITSISQVQELRQGSNWNTVTGYKIKRVPCTSENWQSLEITLPPLTSYDNNARFTDIKIDIDGDFDGSTNTFFGTFAPVINIDYYVAPEYDKSEFYPIQNTGNKLMIRNVDIDNVSDFTSWLSTHNTKVLYPLETPVTIPITNTMLLNQLNAFKLFVGENDINVTSDEFASLLKLTYYAKVEAINEDSLKNINVTFKEKFGPINTIILSRSAESDEIALSIPANLPDEDKKAIKIKDNQILNFNNRDTFMSGILNQLYGLEYYLNDFVSTGITYIDMCDEYEVQIGENTYKCIMFNNETNINQGLSETIYTEKPDDSVNDYKNISETDRQIQQATLEVNKQDSRIKAVAKSIILTTRDDGNSAHIKIQLLNENGDQIGSDIDADIELSGKVQFTDLSTSGRTTINGDNISTGSIKSNNYSAGVSGTKIDLSNGVIDSKNFKVNSTGDMTANSGFIGNWEIENGSLKATDSNGNTIRFTPDYLQTAGPGGNYSIPWILIAQKISQL